MINHKLFYALAGISCRQKQTQNAPQFIAPWTPTSYFYLDKGFAYEYYTLDDETETVSWFWRDGDFIIPTSPYSKIVIADGSEVVEYTYGEVIRELRSNKEMREDYACMRLLHDFRIRERIHDIITLNPLKRYVKLQEWYPWAVEHLNEEQIASYVNISISELRKFMAKQRLIDRRFVFRSPELKDWWKK